MVKAKGLRIQAVMSFHACGGNVGDYAQVPLPDWVFKVGIYLPKNLRMDKLKSPVGLDCAATHYPVCRPSITRQSPKGSASAAASCSSVFHRD